MSKPYFGILETFSLFKIFKMVSRKSSLDRIENFCYNTINPKYDIPPIYFQLNRMILAQPGRPE
jgi:hypothetical protein